MKTKLEIVNTVTEAVKFAFTKLPMTIRLGWLGVVLFFVIFIGGMAVTVGATGGMEFIQSLENMENGDFDPRFIGTILGFYAGLFFWGLLGVLAMVPFIVVMHRIAAGAIEPPHGFAYFRFGGREIKFILANIILSVLAAVVLIITMLPGYLALIIGVLGNVPAEAWQALGSDPEMFEQAVEDNVEGGQSAMSGLIVGLVFLVGIILYVWFSLRAILFTTAAAVENEFAPFSAFGLTGGNVWRIFAAVLFFIVVIFALEMLVVTVLLVGGGIAGAMMIPLFMQGGTAAVIGGVIVGIVVLLLYVLMIAFFAALEIGFKGKMYQSLTRDGAAEPVGG
ncbi:hypothetical protein [Aquisalinus flavus]|uniref:Glycerophosphoryl diester phosphodiesterase membrane domain-containing protein n=1 Tax=Aquisalinus flavus TaxID=1526572 RepID=A0A8J2Y7V2_9PROT|nr:hypothetical protein [Aquisalinus flavus]MBD0426527.1 hypothetical protein [Aquisalinus flavus]UNE47922.1 hypothetical protein FF099_07615 [Aquisalinus flavus]GGD07253.1 hypothetical protein GCM10011342_15070 [Aquisalinus flavus]